MPGRLVGITAKLGDRVKAGQTLASLDSIEIGEAHSAYLQADSQFRLAQADFERAEKLHAEQIVPEKDYLRSRSELEKARANLRAATDKLRLMGVPPARSESAVSVFPVSAPFAGTVIEKTAVLGELAQPDKSLFTVADLSVVWIEANLFEKDLGKIKVGATVGVSVAAYPDELFKGRLTYISSVMDKESRTIKARVEVANADGRLIYANESSGRLLAAWGHPARYWQNGHPRSHLVKEWSFDRRGVGDHALPPAICL